MNPKNWPLGTRILHWLSALLLAACAVAVWSHEAFPKGTPERALAMQIHFALGIGLGAFALCRIAARLFTKAPSHPMSPAMQAAAKIGHAALYILLIAAPLAAYAALSAKGNPINIGFALLPPLPVNPELGKTLIELHEGLANALLGLIALHAAAAFYHAFKLKDQVLASMLGKAK